MKRIGYLDPPARCTRHPIQQGPERIDLLPRRIRTGGCWRPAAENCVSSENSREPPVLTVGMDRLAASSFLFSPLAGNGSNAVFHSCDLKEDEARVCNHV